MRRLFTFALLILSINAFAQNPKKGIKKLEKKEYAEAKVIFNDVLKEEPDNILAFYGLALLYSNREYQEKDFFLSIQFIFKVDTLFSAASPKVIESLDKYITKDSIEYQINRIDNALYDYVKRINDLEITLKFLKVHPGTINFDEAQRLRDEQAYNFAISQNTIASYETFIQKYPKAIQVSKAQKNIHRLAFMEVVSLNTIEGYQTFLTQYPTATEAKEVMVALEKLEFNKAISSKYPVELSKFLNKYPKSNFRKQIEDSIRNVALVPYRKGNMWGYSDLKKNLYVDPIYDTAGFFEYNVAIAKKQGIYLLINKLGESINSKTYDYLDGKFHDGLMRFKKNKLWGFIDTSGVEIVPPKYSAISNFDSGFAKVYTLENLTNNFVPLGIYYEKSDTYIVHIKNKNPSFEKYFLEQNVDLQTTINRKCGIINLTGEIVIPTDYYEVFRLGKNWIATKGNKYKEYYNRHGTDWVGPSQNERDEYLKNTYMELDPYEGFSNFDQWFLFSPSGLLISSAYNHFSLLSDGMIAVSNGGVVHSLSDVVKGYYLNGAKWGYIDTTGNEVVPLIYQNAEIFVDGQALVNASIFIDKKNKVLAKLTENETAFTTSKRWVVFGGNPYDQPINYATLSDFTFKKLYTNFLPPSESLMAVNISTITFTVDFTHYVGGKWGFINQNGIEVIPLKFDDASSFSEGLAAVNVGMTHDSDGMTNIKPGKSGYIDHTGKMIIPLQFDAADPFSEGLAAVKIGMSYDSDSKSEKSGSYGFIDNTGKIVIPAIYDYDYLEQPVEKFKGGYAIVRKNGKLGLISKSNEIKIPIEYVELTLWKHGFYIYSNDTQYPVNKGIITISGKVLQPAKYSNLVLLEGNSDFGRVDVDGKSGFIKYDGTEYFE